MCKHAWQQNKHPHNWQCIMHINQDHMWRRVDCAFWHERKRNILNFFHKVKQLIKYFPKKSCIVCERPSERKCWKNVRCWMLHHDNTPFMSLSIHQFLKGITFPCYHNHYYPNLPCDFQHFPKLKQSMKKKWTDTSEDIISNICFQSLKQYIWLISYS